MHRIVVKLRTNVIMRPDGRVALGLLCGLVEQIAELRSQGVEVLVVSSGAVGLGMERLGLLERPTVVAQIQACAAIGQSRLMSLYDDAFDRLGCPIAQVLLTEDDFRDPLRHANLRATLDALLTMGVIPIVNENDTVSTIELDRATDLRPRERIFGDNDKLSALLLVNVYVRGQTQLATGLARGVRPGDNPGPQYARMLMRLTDSERFPRLTAAMAQRAAGPPADFADDAFRFGLATILDGIACQA